MIRVGVSGAAGRMGRIVAETVAGQPDLELHGMYDPVGQDLAVAGMPIATDPDALAGSDVVVDFTHPNVVIANVAVWHGLGAHAVVGTSGFDESRVAAVEDLWTSDSLHCLIVPNFSVGAVVMIRLAELAAPHFDAAEIIELHHDQKADAPSGTALETARRVAQAAGRQSRAVESLELRRGARGAEVDGVRVHSVRLPGLLAHQQVSFGGPGETLSIRHDTTDRTSFMPGVLLGVRGVAGLESRVTVGLEGLLGL